MHRKFRNMLTAALAALLFLTAAAPAALADPATPPAGTLTLLTNKDAADDNDKAEYYAVPTGKPGDKITLYVPLQCAGNVENVTCEIVQAGLPAAFQTPTSLLGAVVGGSGSSIAALTDGQKAYFSFSLTLASAAAAGEATVPVEVKYQVGGVDAAPLKAPIKCKVEAAAVVTEAPTEAPVVTPTPAPIEEIVTYDAGSSGVSSGGSGGSGFRTKPKVVVESYRFDAEKIYAGEQVTLSLLLRNTSAREAVRNLELKFSNEAGVVMPVSGGSNSIYIGELKKSTAILLKIPLEIAPDAEAKAQSLALEVLYEGTRNKQEFTEKSSITVPVYQRTRVRTDQPQVYDEAWVGQTVSMSVQLFNMGKATLYNCMVDVQGEGLSLEETYYGGNIASGSTMRADLTIKTDVAGEIGGQVVITYEDVFGEQSQETLPFSVTVNEEAPVDMEVDLSGMPQPEEDTGVDLLRFWWVALIVVLTALLFVLLAILKRRRARALIDDAAEEDMPEDEMYHDDSEGDEA